MTARVLDVPELPPVDGAALDRRLGRQVVGVVPSVESVNGMATLKGLGAAGVPRLPG